MSILLEKLKANVFTRYEEGFDEYVLQNPMFVFIEDDWSGEMVLVRALKQGCLRDKERNDYPIPDSMDKVFVLIEDESWKV